MTTLVFSDLETECYDHLGLDSSSQTRVDRWLNYVQNDICSRWQWPFLFTREAIATIADYTTGTVDIANGATSVTGHSTVFTTTHGDGTYFIQFAGSNDFYNVASRSGNTSITLQNAFQGTSLTGVAFILRKFFYSLSSAVDEVLDVRNWETPVKLIQVDFRTIDLINPLVQSTDPGYGYIMFGVDGSGNQVFSPYPFPSDTRLYEFRTKKRPTDGAISIPNKYAQVIAWGAIAVGFGYLRKLDLATAWNAKYESKIAQMIKEYRQSGDYQPVMGSIDQINRTKWIQMPSTYPVIQS